MAVSRRGFGGTALAFVASLASSSIAEAVETPFVAIERRSGGRLGVFAFDTANNRSLAHRADERFPLESTFKGPLAAAVLARVDAGADRLDAPVHYGRGDIVPASPVTNEHLGAGALSVQAMTAAILERSDNTAANLLLRRVGGPAALTSWLQSIGDRTTSVHRYEIMPGQSGPENTTTPRAIAVTAARISLGDVLRPDSRTFLNRCMANNSIARQRLRGAFPSSWRAVDRTGTRADVRNDYAVIWPPNREPLVIAAYLEKPDLQPDEGEAVLRNVGAAVGRSFLS